MELEYLNLGFASAQVTFVPSVSEDKTRLDLTVRIVEGVQTIVDHVIIVGNHKTAEEVIRRELAFKPGAPLGLRDLIESRSRLSSLGLFRRIDIRELEHGPSSRRDVLVTVEEAPATAIGYGGGLEATRFRIAGPDGEAVEDLQLLPRGFFDIGRRNLGGKNRSVNLFTRVSLRPNDSVESPDNPGSIGLNEYRVVGTFREPRALRWNADFMLTGAIEQGSRSSFNFNRKGVTAELIRRLTVGVRTSVRYTFSTTRTFDERLSESGPGAHRPPFSAGPALGRVRRDFARPAERCGRADQRDVPQRGNQHGVAGDRRGSRLPENLPAGILVQADSGCVRA